MQHLRILVTYASGHGSTVGVAGQIAAVFRDAGATVGLFPVGHAPDPARYDAVVIGSPIRYDRWLPEATTFVTAHEAALSTRPVACFFTCMALSLPDGERQGRNYAERIAAQGETVTPVSIGRFAGALDYGKFPLLLWLPAWLLFTFLGAKSGDYRNFDEIRDWSRRCLGVFTRKNKENPPCLQPS